MPLPAVMAGLDPAIHVFATAIPPEAWMPGSAPGMSKWCVARRYFAS